MQVIEILREGKNKVGPGQSILGISAVDGVASKSRRIAEVFQATLAIPAGPVDASDPGNSDARTHRNLRRRAVDDLTHDLMTGDQFPAQGRKFAFNDMQISSADAAGPHSQEHLPSGD